MTPSERFANNHYLSTSRPRPLERVPIITVAMAILLALAGCGENLPTSNAAIQTAFNLVTIITFLIVVAAIGAVLAVLAFLDGDGR